MLESSRHVLGTHAWAPRRLPGWLARKRLCTMAEFNKCCALPPTGSGSCLCPPPDPAPVRTRSPPSASPPPVAGLLATEAGSFSHGLESHSLPNSS